jgi:predicted nucleic acid-binding protein
VTTAADRILVDTNVLVYASLRNSAWHGHAIQALHTELQGSAEIWSAGKFFASTLRC